MFTSEDLDKFRALRITQVATRFGELVADEANDDLAPEQLFLTAVDDTLDMRKANWVNAAIKTAGLPIPSASIAEIDYREGRGLNKARMARYSAHDWKADNVNVLIRSATGGGKTYLACAIGIAACHNGHRVTFARMDDLARKLVITRADGLAHQQLLNDLSETDLLIIDDFLTVGIDPEAASDLYAILANREYHRPTMVASQSGPEYWSSALPDKVAADSIVNRLVSKAKRINLGDIDMSRQYGQEARSHADFWE